MVSGQNKMRRESTLVRRGRENSGSDARPLCCALAQPASYTAGRAASSTPGLPPAISVPTQLLTTVHQHPGKEGEASSSGLKAPPAIARPRQHGVGQAPDSGCVLLTGAHPPRRPGASPARAPSRTFQPPCTGQHPLLSQRGASSTRPIHRRLNAQG